MPVVAKSGGGGNFELAPEGLYCAAISKVVDDGLKETPWGPKQKVSIFYQLDERSPLTGRRYSVRSQFGLSLHADSNLSGMLEGLFGKKFTDAERAEGYDLETLVGKVCQVQIVHAPGTKGGAFANVMTVIPAPKTFTMEIEKDEPNSDGTPF